MSVVIYAHRRCAVVKTTKECFILETKFKGRFEVPKEKAKFFIVVK